jgi:hypothetical protein
MALGESSQVVCVNVCDASLINLSIGHYLGLD